jgi:hypothetical protein
MAWACGPSSQVYSNTAQYAPGESGTLEGVNFYSGAKGTIDIEGGPTLASITVPQSATTFSVGFTAPSTPGKYLIVANVVDAQGNSWRSTPAAITVAAPQPAPTAGSSTGSQSAPGNAAPAPAGGTAQSPAKTTSKSRQPARRPTAKSKQAHTASTKPSATTTAAPAQVDGAFADSLPQPAAAVATSTSRRSSRTARTNPATTAKPSESIAKAEAWGGLSTSRDAALVPTGSYPASASSSSNAGRTVGIVLLTLGLAALVGGVGIGEARRRRVGG